MRLAVSALLLVALAGCILDGLMSGDWEAVLAYGFALVVGTVLFIAVRHIGAGDA